MTTIDEAINQLHGDPETFRPLLEPEAIVRMMCRMAKRKADQLGVPTWVIIKEMTAHGSGVSNAIYQVYKPE